MLLGGGAQSRSSSRRRSGRDARTKLVEAGFPDALAFMTSRDITRWPFSQTRVEDVEAACLTTVGLSSGERVGSRRYARAWAGTINTLMRVSRPLTDGALVEALSIVAEAA
jgi:adenosylcobinamide amidohydrolase